MNLAACSSPSESICECSGREGAGTAPDKINGYGGRPQDVLYWLAWRRAKSVCVCFIDEGIDELQNKRKLNQIFITETFLQVNYITRGIW